MSPRLIARILFIMLQDRLEIKENVSANAANEASVEPANVNEMKQETMSENVTYFTSDELGQLGKDLGIKPTAVKANINGKDVGIIVAHTEYGMRHTKKMDKILTTVNKEKLLTPRYHFCKPKIFWKEGYNLFDNKGEVITEGTENVYVICDTPETSERIYIDDFLKDVEIHDFESVADYAQHIGETALISRMPSKVEEMGIAAMATGDAAVKEAYEFAIENGITYTQSLGYLAGEMKAATLKLMMRGVKAKPTLTLGRTKAQAQQLYDESCKSLGEGEAKKRYVPRALNIILKKEQFSFDIVIEALQTIPSSDVTMAKLADCGEKEACIAGALISWILTLQRQNGNKAVA
jgi:hypothetical protein